MGVRRFLRAAGDVVLPRRCVVCGCRLLMAEDFICLGCLTDMPLTRYWERARNPMADGFNERIQKRLEGRSDAEMDLSGSEGCGCMTRRNEHYSYAAALFFYHSEAGYRHIPYQIKYHGNIALGKHFGRILGQKLSDGGHWEDADLVVPVPLHWARRWKRGYNQAEVIAGALAEILGVPMRTDILERRKRTKTQVKISIEEKGRNVSGAFEATETARTMTAGSVRHILLVDDVFTTGSTLEACHNALRAVFPPPMRISAVTLGYLER